MPSFTWDHVHLRTPDPEGTAQWFERMFGAEVIRSMQQGKPRIDIKLGGAMIFTAQVNPGDGVNPAPATPYQGLDHFGIAVSGIDTIAADLKKKGVEFTQEPHSPRPGIKICFLRGPQGISISALRGLVSCGNSTLDECLDRLKAAGCIVRNPDKLKHLKVH